MAAVDFSQFFSQRAREMKASDVRELLKLLQMPDMISFAGGLPNPESFPVDVIRQIVCDVLDENGGKALQYGITEGFAPLRESIARRMTRKGMDVGTENVLVVSGSQQVIDLLGKVFVDPNDTIVVSKPTYLAALTGFNTFQASYEAVPIDEDNMRMDLFEERMAELARKSIRPKLVYVLPNFQNPAGVTMPERNRRRIVDLASEYDFIIFEDDPYGELRFGGQAAPSMRSWLDGRAVLLGSFSKTVAPGLRLGWVCAPQEIMGRLIVAKQASDLHSNSLCQRVLYEYLTCNDVDQHIATIIAAYRRQRDAMVTAIEEHFPAEVSFTRPEGGMFLWVTLPDRLSALELSERAINEDVAFVPGTPFFVDGGGGNNMRLNFSNADEHRIGEGIQRLGRIMKNMLAGA